MSDTIPPDDHIEEEEAFGPTVNTFVRPSTHADPDHHWLILTPGLDSEWLFDTAQRYWKVFRPTIMRDLSLMNTIPANERIALTVLGRSDTIRPFDEAIVNDWANVLYDRVVIETLSQMKAELDRRASLRQRFG